MAAVQFDVLLEAAQARAEAAALDQDIDSIGTTTKKSGAEAAAGLNGIEKAAKPAAAAVAAAQQRAEQYSNAVRTNEAAIRANNSEIARLNKSLVELKSTGAGGTDAAKKMASEMARLRAETSVISNENRLLNAAIKEVTSASDSSRTGFNRLTSQVRTSGTVFEGYDSVLTAVLGATGGVTVGTTVLISVIGGLIPSLFNLGNAKKEILLIGEKEIATNALLAESYVRLGSSASIGARGFIPFEQNAQAVTEANIATTLLGIAEAQQQVEKESVKVAAAFKAIDLEKTRTDFGGLADVVGMAREQIKTSSLAIVENQQKVAAGVAALRMMRDVFGYTTDQLIDFAARAGSAPKDLDAMRRAVNSDIDSLAKFAEEVSQTTGRVFNLQQSVHMLTLTLAQVRMPKISIEGLQGIEGASDVVQRGIATLEEKGITDRRRQAAALDSDIRALIDTMKREAAANAATDAEARKLYNTYKNKLHPAQFELVTIIENSAKRMSAFTDNTDKAEQKARALAQTIRTLALEQRQSNLAAEVPADPFAERIALIKIEMDNRREALKAQEQLTEETSRSITNIEQNRIRTVLREKDEAVRRERDAIRRAAIQTTQDEYDRRRAMDRFDNEQTLIRLRTEFGLTQEYWDLTDKYKRQKQEEFLQWFIDRQIKAHEQIQRAIEQLNRQQADAMAASITSGIPNSDFEAQQERLGNLGNQFNAFGVPDVAKLDAADAAIRRLGLSQNQVNELVELSNGNLDVFLNHLAAIEAYSQGDVLGGLRESFSAVLNTMDLAQAGAGAFANALQEAFVRSIAYGENFAEVFGKTLLAGILNAIGQQAIAEGTYHILAGTAKLFNPFTAAEGAREIAAGAALVAFGSALVGAAAAITSSLNKQNASTGAAAGGGSASSGGGSTGGRRERPPTRIPVPTSGPGSGPPLILNFDSKDTASLVMRTLEGNGFVSLRTAGGRHNRPLKKALK